MSTTAARSSPRPSSTSQSSTATPTPTHGRATAPAGGAPEEGPRQFFLFCQQSLVEEGFFLHKYTPYGQPGSSWLPWVDSSGRRTRPIQEDGTGPVRWGTWQHPPPPRQ